VIRELHYTKAKRNLRHMQYTKLSVNS